MKRTRDFMTDFASISCLTVLALAGQAQAQTGLTKIDINNPVAGIVTLNPDSSTTVTAGGGDTYGTADSFTYLYGQRSGDFDVKVKVIDVNVDDPDIEQVSAKASLQVRANLTPGSPNIQVSGTPAAGANYVETIARPTQGGETNDPPLSAPSFRYFGGPYPGTFRPATGDLYAVWLRVKRTGNLFQTMCSKDNLRWTVLAEYSMDLASFPDTLYVGLAAVAHIEAGETASNRVRSTFSDFQDVASQPAANINGTPVAPGNAPGTYPTSSVTSVNWQISLPPDGIGRSADNSQSGPIVWNVAGGGFATISRDLLLSIDGQQGPIPFSIGRYATGALDPGIGPRDPVAAQSNLGPYSNPGRDRDTPAVTDPASQAWFPSPSHGIMIPTVRVNGPVQWNDGAAPFYPHAYEAVDFSSAQYFNMDDGTFGNGVFYTRMAKRGDTDDHPNTNANTAQGFQRAAFNVSTAWLPYADGWMSGCFSRSEFDGGAFWRSPGTHSAAATQGTLSLNPNSAGALLAWTDLGSGSYGGLATLSLPGIDSRDDGMLFLVPNDDGTNRGPQANCSVKADGSGWNVAIRSVADIDLVDSYIPSGNDEFSFLHVPYTASKLIGGKIAGTTGAKVNSAGNFSVTRATAGRYQITIPGKTGASGMLILQAVGELPSQPGTIDNVSLSYQYEGSAFVVESRVLDPFGGTNGHASSTLRDSDFYFTWVDFAEPLSAAGPPLPPLSIVKNGSMVTLSWPVGATGYFLESSANLGQPWTPVPGVTNNTVTLPLTPALQKEFFRLRTTPTP